MSTNGELPFIPLSELRAIYQQALLYYHQESFDSQALWRLMVAIEVNSRLANEWYVTAQLQENTIERLTAENRQLKDALRQITAVVVTDYIREIMGKIESYVEKARPDEDGARTPNRSDATQR